MRGTIKQIFESLKLADFAVAAAAAIAAVITADKSMQGRAH